MTVILIVGTAPAHVVGNVRGVHLSFAALLAAGQYASGRSCDRPTDQLNTTVLAPLSHKQIP
jgi:hypothetical protein